MTPDEPLAPESSSPSGSLTPSERRVVALLAMVQFVNVLDFMMVMPLGPDFARALAIPTSALGLIGGSYTAAASVSGLVAAFMVDRFRRKRALVVTMAGLAIATLAGALATGLPSLLFARVLAGAFGGPATSLALAMVADAVPIARRGRALGIVMGAFSIASIAGVPAGLELGRLGGWRAPFLGVGLLTFAVVGAMSFTMPDVGATPSREGLTLERLLRQLRGRDNTLSLAAGMVVLFANFLVVPNIASFAQRNLGYPRDRVGLMYLCGGAASLVSMQLAGRAIDRFGARYVSFVGTGMAMVAVWLAFLHEGSLHPIAFSTLFMAGASVRALAFNALTSRVPAPSERGAFMSLQSTVQHLASAAGAFVSSQLLSSDEAGRLLGLGRVATWSLVLSTTVPLFITMLELGLNRRDAKQPTLEPAV
jgi:predicted MFS family arabinose efflux permease